MHINAIHISREATVKEIQSDFSHLFPFLIINFYSNYIKQTDACVMYASECRISDINPDCPTGYIEIADGMTVSEVEGKIRNVFNLHAEISSKIDKRKILSEQTTHWLLNEKYPGESYQYKTVDPKYFKPLPFGI